LDVNTTAVPIFPTRLRRVPIKAVAKLSGVYANSIFDSGGGGPDQKLPLHHYMEDTYPSAHTLSRASWSTRAGIHRYTYTDKSNRGIDGRLSSGQASKAGRTKP